LPGRKSRVGGTGNLDFGQNFGSNFALLFWGVKPVTFRPRAREEWEIICSARNQEIYWRIALLAYDEPIKTFRGSVKMTGTQKPERAITFAAPPIKFVFGSLANPRITLGQDLSIGLDQSARGHHGDRALGFKLTGFDRF